MRLPPKEKIILLFMICCFPIHLWAIFIFLHEFPAYLMYLKPFEIASILAYVLAFALLESLLAAGILTLIAILLPRQWFRERFVAQGVILVTVSAIWLVPLHFWIYRLLSGSSDQVGIGQLNPAGILWPALLWFVTYITALFGFTLALHRSAGLEEKLIELADRFTLPSTIFIGMDLLSIGTILVRNWF